MSPDEGSGQPGAGRPFLTGEVEGVPCEFRARPEDFVVEEIPAYAPSGSGTHTFVWIEKRGIGTHSAVRRLAEHLGVPAGAVGRAGLKDARSVARQMLSVPDTDPASLEGLELGGVRVLDAVAHTRKLRVGHLRGNRFAVRLRGVASTDVARVESVLGTLSARGVPNYFGSQRFGARGDTWKIGRALLREDWEGALGWLCGRPAPGETPRIAEARALFDQGRHGDSAALWPPDFGACARACRSLARGEGPERAVRAVGRSMARFYVGAYQSRIFNAVVAERVGELDRVRCGDLAMKHPGGAVFHVEDVAAEQPRAVAFEISPTGPLFGPRMTLPGDDVRAMEERAAETAGGSHGDFAPGPYTRRGGARRALRARLADPAVAAGDDGHGSYAEVAFTLPPGSYATCVLREVGKGGLVDRATLAGRGAASAGS